MVAPRQMPSREYLLSVFDYEPETGKLRWKFREGMRKDWNAQRAGKEAGSKKTEGYLQVGLDGRVLYFHRIVWAIVYGDFPASTVIDHIDGDKSNNRISNLRIASNSENNANAKRASDNKSGIKGVSWVKRCQKWHVAVVFEKKNHFVGEFAHLEDAAAAVRIARDKIHGDFARFE